MHYLKLIKNNLSKERILRCLFYSAIPACIFYFISLSVLYENGFDVMEILRDPAQQSGESSFLGFLSNIGIWLWVSSGAICFSSLCHSDSRMRDKELLILAGLLSFMLAIDDFFLIHDRYINQRICYLTYAMIAGSILARHRQSIMDICGFSFILAGTLLALSILTDLTQDYIPLSYHVVQVFEEGFKFMGASVWLYFCAQVTSSTIKVNHS